ncbi:hypothetical protein BJV78DRAFT_1286576 [Lactifluus subvellereus]|nr:hypothetical protein BJV78DRAFT_1286576 [Lactifluus subvellereus]
MPPSQPPQDHYRMLLQAASVIRSANGFLQAYRTNKNCILVAAYVGCNGDTALHPVSGQEKGSSKGLLQENAFRSNERVERILFAPEVYYFFFALGKERHNEDAIKKI